MKTEAQIIQTIHIFGQIIKDEDKKVEVEEHNEELCTPESHVL